MTHYALVFHVDVVSVFGYGTYVWFVTWLMNGVIVCLVFAMIVFQTIG